MRRLLDFLRRKRLTPLERAERASKLAAPTVAIGHVRAQQRRAKVNELLAEIDPAKADAIRDQVLLVAYQHV